MWPVAVESVCFYDSNVCIHTCCSEQWCCCVYLLWNRPAGLWLTNSAGFRAELSSRELTDLVWSWGFTFLCNYTISLNQRGNGRKLSLCCCHQISEPRAFAETLCRYLQSHHGDFSWFRLKSLRKQTCCIGSVFWLPEVENHGINKHNSVKCVKSW